MKLKINISGFKFKPDYFTKLLGVVHKWIGHNDMHDKMSLYTYSFIHTDFFIIASYDKDLYNKIISGILNDEKMFDNVKFVGVEKLKIYTNKTIFKSLSPFFVKDNQQNHLIFKDAEKRAKDILISKSKKAGIDLGFFDLEFVNFKKNKLIKIHNINNKCFISDIKITGSDIVKKFACQVGIGSSTGCGFGIIY